MCIRDRKYTVYQNENWKMKVPQLPHKNLSHRLSFIIKNHNINYEAGITTKIAYELMSA